MKKSGLEEISTEYAKTSKALGELHTTLARRAQTAGESINLLIDSARILQGSLRNLNKSLHEIQNVRIVFKIPEEIDKIIDRKGDFYAEN